MVHTITLKKVGGSISATIPKDLASRHHLAANDKIFAMETADGILLTTVDPTTKAALDAYTELAKENRAAMAALAKL